ncbi:MAG: 16S rRNA (cytosine(1402)-N(4))-methyltransferase RsmH [Ignavibacteriae bacterium]|nr:MAG: 16S rRNA (cytosine(1402)-N(4))-methyltransferase RsmH [Ignavibacteriota bacterium]
MARLDPSDYHVPVMAQECLDALNLRPGGHYVDATLGGGGHTSLILSSEQRTASPHDGRLTMTVFDADEVAIARCTERFADLPPGQLTIVHANFEEMAEHLQDRPPVDGVLFDLGVSSFQFDHHARGFSYRMDAPLDMRFTPEGPTAADLLNTLSEDKIVGIIREFGEDPSAKRLAAAIVRRRMLAPYRTTVDLRDTIVQHIPPQHHNKTLARVFQALRIAVNRELERLEHALESVLPHMAPGGRIVVMSYHSLEDRIVKDVFKRHSGPNGAPPLVKILTKKPVMASDEEVARNPRARSARLRVAEVVGSSEPLA